METCSRLHIKAKCCTVQKIEEKYCTKLQTFRHLLVEHYTVQDAGSALI